MIFVGCGQKINRISTMQTHFYITLVTGLGSALLILSANGIAADMKYGTVVPERAKDGDLSLSPCEVYLEGDDRHYAGDCGTLVVPENRNNPNSRLIALPVTRVNATAEEELEPIFWFEGGPGGPNRILYPTDGLVDKHDFVMVGYRGIEGQVNLDCPEISDAVRSTDGDYLGDSAFAGYALGATACVERLATEGVDLDGYSINQTIDDNESARKAMGYDRINLFGNSYGTRVQMLYQWRYPNSIHRDLMVAVNPPGHFIFDPLSLEELLVQYAELCSEDTYCSARTADLLVTMREVSLNMPSTWMGIDIDADMVKLITNISLHESIALGGPPLYGPGAIDLWLDAAEGDASGMALVSLIAPFILPEAFEWGHFLSMGGSAPDFNDPDRDYKKELTPDTIIGSPLSLLIWGIMQGWTTTSDQSVGEVQDSNIETLLISGALDGSTPFQYARDELMPQLSKGHHVIIKDQAHTETFWFSQPEARAHLLNTFFDSGKVDDSLFVYQAPVFEVDTGWSDLAKLILAVTVFVSIALLLVIVVIARKLHTKLTSN